MRGFSTKGQKSKSAVQRARAATKGSHDTFLLDLPDDILELILLSLHSPLWLVWATSTCKRWRRIISAVGFTRRFHAIHSRRPVVAGSYHNDYNNDGYMQPRFGPSPFATAIHASNFSLNFLPGSYNNKWRCMIEDSHGSLLLLYREEAKSRRRDLIVCEPLTRCHEVIPPPKPPVLYWKPSIFYCGATVILLDGGGDDSGEGGRGGVIGMSSFRVLLCSIEDGCIRVCMFTSSVSSSWRQTSIDVPPKMHAIGFAIDRRYWYDGEKRMVALDQSILKFSSFVLPDDEYSECRKMSCVTVGHDGEPRIVVRGRGNMIKIFVRLKGGSEDTEEWALEKTVQVSAAMLGLRELQFFVLTTDQPAGMVRFDAYEFSRHGFSMSMTFHLDMETMKTEGLAGRGVHYGHKAYPLELPWPPTLHACTMASQIHPGVSINVYFACIVTYLPPPTEMMKMYNR